MTELEFATEEPMVDLGAVTEKTEQGQNGPNEFIGTGKLFA